MEFGALAIGFAMLAVSLVSFVVLLSRGAQVSPASQKRQLPSDAHDDFGNADFCWRSAGPFRLSGTAFVGSVEARSLGRCWTSS